MKKQLMIALAIIPHLAFALPYKDGVLLVGERQFFVGDLSWSFEESANTFLFRQSPWLDTFVDLDSELYGYDLRLLQSGIPGSDLVANLPSHMRDRATLATDPLYLVEGHDVFSYGNVSLEILPTVSALIYSVSCSRGLTEGEMNSCRIRVAYPYGSHVVLTADKFLPGKLPDIGQKFEGIAERMVEIAVCLDVTVAKDKPRPHSADSILENNPNLSGCSIDLVS